MDSTSAPRIKKSGMLHLPQNTMTVNRVSKTVLITTETWIDVEAQWVLNGVTVAANGYTWVMKWDKGKHYAIRKTLNEKNELVGVYVDICSAVEIENDIFSYTDWYLDIWMDMLHATDPQIIDQEEFRAAMGANLLSAEEAGIAKSTADILVKVIKQPEFYSF